MDEIPPQQNPPPGQGWKPGDKPEDKKPDENEQGEPAKA